MAHASFTSGSKAYFFSGDQYIRVTRGQSGPGTVDAGYPKSIDIWGWGEFGRNGVDAVLPSGPKTYFFAGGEYIRVSRGETGPGTVDAGYPKPLSTWKWDGLGPTGIDPRQDFGVLGRPGAALTVGIDAALSSGSKAYFFSGDQYLRVTRGATGAGTVDPGYPKPLAVWGWGTFGRGGIDAALDSGPKTYFFAGDEYIRVSRGQTGPGTVDAGYPKPISTWRWGEFGTDWAAMLSNHSFDTSFTVAQREQILERQRLAIETLESCGSVEDDDRALVMAAYRRPIRYGIEPSANGRAWLNRNWLFVNLNNFANSAAGQRELAQTLLHETTHIAGFSHPERQNSDVPGDGGAYYGSVPLQAELCIDGVQSDEACVDNGGTCSM